MTQSFAYWTICWLTRVALLACIVLDGLCQFVPGQAVTAFGVETLDGTFKIQTQTGSNPLPLLLTAYDKRDASSRYMWHDTTSVRDFVKSLPSEVHCLFLTYADEAKADAEWMQASIRHQVNQLNFSIAEAQQLWKHMHFATASVSEVGHWISSLLNQWTSPHKIILVTSQQESSWNLTTERLDSAYGWLPWPDTLPSAPLGLLADPCQTPPGANFQGANLEGQLALALLPDDWHPWGSCSLAGVVRHAQKSKATAVIIAAPQGQDVTLINCKDQECTWPLSIPATMIGYQAGQDILEVLNGSTSLLSKAAESQPLQATFHEQQVPGFYAGIDEQGKLIELGWSKWPSLMHLAWQGQWQHYLQHLHANLSRPALTVPVFVNQNLSGPGLDAGITLPPLVTLHAHDTFELDFALSCPGSRDKDCPVWDHTIQLFVCCDDPTGQAPPCTPCDPTVWSEPFSPPSPSASGGAGWDPQAPPGEVPGSRVSSRPQSASSAQCGRELGRWITPFRRRIGRWLTDVTPLMPLLIGQQCHFHLQTAPWALTWTPSLTLRFTNTTHPRAMNPNTLQLRTNSCQAEEEDPVARLPRKLQSAPSSNSAGASSLAALPLPGTDSVHPHAQGTLAPAVSVNQQQHVTDAVKSNNVVIIPGQQQAALRAVTAAGKQQASSLTHAVQNQATAAGASVMPGQLADSGVPAKPAGLPLTAAGARIDAAGARTDAAGAKTDAAGAKTDAAGANPDAATPTQSQGDPVITTSSPSISPAKAYASPAESETAQQAGAEQSHQADMTASADFAVRRPQPHGIVPLFDGGDFGAGYNDKYKPVEFVTPAGLQKAVLEAVITGHGYDNHQCAEFCITSHHFIVNGHEHMLNFTEAGKPWGCANKVLEGSEPNEHGTWQYGRGGWCDGQEVRPWVVDITCEMKLGNAINMVSYHGLFGGKSPKPDGQPGFIMMQSNIVFYV